MNRGINLNPSAPEVYRITGPRGPKSYVGFKVEVMRFLTLDEAKRLSEQGAR